MDYGEGEGEEKEGREGEDGKRRAGKKESTVF